MATYVVGSAPGRAGLDVTTSAVAVASTDVFPNDGSTHLAVVNGSAGSLTVTFSFASSVSVDGQVPTNPTATVAAGDTRIFGPFPTQYYNDPVTGKVTVGYSSTTTIKAYAYKTK